MTQEQKAELAMIYGMQAELNGRTLSQSAMIMLVNSLEDLDFFAVKKVLSDWMRFENRFPMPADIRAKIMPELSTKDNAIDAVNAAIACVSKFGYTNAEAAKNKMGDLAWEAVQRFGGWKQLCETLSFDNEGIIRAQLRELTEVVFKKSQRGELNQSPKLPENNLIKNLVNNSLKAIE